MKRVFGRAAIAALAITALSFGPAGMARSDAVNDGLIGTAWLADDIGGRGVVDRVQSTLEFAEPGRVAGLAGCNRYFGPATLAGNTISFGNLASTRMMCPDALMDQEQRFFQALSAAKRLELTHEGRILHMYADDGAPVLRFSRIVEK